MCSIYTYGQIDQQLHQPYHTSWKLDAPLLISGGGLALSQFLINSDEAIDLNYVNALSSSDINRLDRSGVNHYSSGAARGSDVLFYTSLASPIFLFAAPKVRKDWKRVTLIMAETYLIAAGITSLTKNVVDRPRPFLFNDHVPIEDKLGADAIKSFVSGHTSMTAVSTFMMAKILVDYHPDTKWKPLIWTVAAGIPAATGILRYKSGKHFITDVISGYAIGALVGTMVPYTHKKIKHKLDRKNNKLSNLWRYDPIL